MHQTQWQKEMLLTYGQEISLLDATYKTSMWDMPLYLLCVCANVGYGVVASIITEDETASSLVEGLTLLQQQNQDWHPQHFMCDFSRSEINALEEVFPGN